MDLRIKFKPRKYTIKAQSLNWAYYDFWVKLPPGACWHMVRVAMVQNSALDITTERKHYMFIM